MPSPDLPPSAGIDTSTPSIARAYDAALGGKDNFAVDREAMQELERIAPGMKPLARENRAFLGRVCRFLAADMGITQFLDCGSGLPTADNVHQVVQRINPEARVVYVDNDPVVLAHGRALLEENERTRFAAADIFEPHDLLNNEIVRAHIDFTQPLALLQVATMHSYDGPHPDQVMAEYIDALPSGSFLGFSQFFDPEDEYHELAKHLQKGARSNGVNIGNFRTRAQIEPMLAGLELLEPGLVYTTDWRPDGPRTRPRLPAYHLHVGALGRKP
ncbi:SAM-dependent methyltransferase [Saccharopolyspora phatthalungensis]|uniref:SAM-dependent methyltransferase n=1 Tax=Saccharopolyspora phatthalungensis TaxID=664693 RepID=A0A840QB86_9PSEU|nr:SAM-dependent methyltransferase [Saccharopolyspora phatthalungensis]MBB5154113.1 SAM-dependent methyltransferase [Saccharopolyspora phatthalungensis]